jgi:hypothetical protein
VDEERGEREAMVSPHRSEQVQLWVKDERRARVGHEALTETRSCDRELQFGLNHDHLPQPHIYHLLSLLLHPSQ